MAKGDGDDHAAHTHEQACHPCDTGLPSHALAAAASDAAGMKSLPLHTALCRLLKQM